MSAAAFKTWLRDRGDAVVNDDPDAAATLHLAAEHVPASLSAPAWGQLPSAAEVTAHVARCAPARGSDGAPWAFRCVDSSGDYVAIVYLRAQGDVVVQREPGGGVWYLPRAWHRDAQWRPVDGEGMPVGRVT